jgi:uncharacterized heparinase superfamily protein
VKVLLYVDAARRMTLRQLVVRTRRIVPPALLAAGTRRQDAPEWRPLAAGLGADPAPQSGPTPSPHETGTFVAVGASRTYRSPAFWTDKSDGLLFLFHLHGFSTLASYAAGERSAQGDQFWAEVVSDWLANESRPRRPSWHPYPTSLRLIAWSAGLSVLAWPQALRQRIAGELARQARYLRRSIEYDIGGNHVLKNATALVVAGAVVPASAVLSDGLRVLRREAERQILADGGHEERSTSYHLAVAHDLSDVAQLLRRRDGTVPSWLKEVLARARAWEAAMTGPDGRLPLLNDAWESPPRPSRVSEPVSQLRQSGYLVFRHERDQATFDVGPVSPPHLPPHAHADVLSFVFWADGRPLVVDPGSYVYTGPWRNHFRGTSAHNTVEIDGVDQCELWGDFRVAFPPRVRVGVVRSDRNYAVATASHDGYRRLADPVEHHRTLVWLPRNGLVVVDRLRARRAHAVRTRLHVAPGVRWDEANGVAGFEVVALGGGEVRQAEAAYSPFLGRKVPIDVLEDVRTVEPDTPFGWSVLRKGVRVARLELERVDVSVEGQSVLTVPLGWN